MYTERPIVVVEKKENSLLKWIGIFALICAIPFLCMLIVPLGFLGGIAAMIGAFVAVQNYGWWLLGAAIAIPLYLAMKDRISGKHNLPGLTLKIKQLENELLEAKHHILLLEEEKEFNRKLEMAKAERQKDK